MDWDWGAEVERHVRLKRPMSAGQLEAMRRDLLLRDPLLAEAMDTFRGRQRFLIDTPRRLMAMTRFMAMVVAGAEPVSKWARLEDDFPFHPMATTLSLHGLLCGAQYAFDPEVMETIQAFGVPGDVTHLPKLLPFPSMNLFVPKWDEAGCFGYLWQVFHYDGSVYVCRVSLRPTSGVQLILPKMNGRLVYTEKRTRTTLYRTLRTSSLQANTELRRLCGFLRSEIYESQPWSLARHERRQLERSGTSTLPDYHWLKLRRVRPVFEQVTPAEGEEEKPTIQRHSRWATAAHERTLRHERYKAGGPVPRKTNVKGHLNGPEHLPLRVSLRKVER